MRKKTLAALLPLLLLVGCGRKEERAATVPVASSGPTEMVKLTPVDEIYEASGTVRARNTAVLSARVPGSITTVSVKAGDRVAKGQVLVTLESTELDAQVSRAKAGQAAAQAGILEAERGLAAAEANARLAAATFNRYRDLLAKKSVSQQEYEEAEARHHTAQAGVEMARARQQQARAHTEEAEAASTAARSVRSYATLAAPFSGMVAERKADPGTMAYPGLPLLLIEDGQFRLEVDVAESRAPALRVGQTARVVFDREQEVRIEEIVPAADPATRSVLVKLALPGPVAGLRSGMYGRARFTLGRRDALTVPATALERRGQLVSVMVEENGQLGRRLITAGATIGGRVEVLSGLQAGEKVAVRP